MKKTMALLLVLVLTLSLLAACAPKKEEASNESGQEPKVETIKIGVTMSSRDQFLSTLETAIKDSASSKENVEIIAFDSENDIQKQISHVGSFVSSGCSAIIVNLVNTDTTQEILNAAGDIPVVFVNRMPSEEILKSVDKASYVGSDEHEAGKLQAEFLSTYFKDKEAKELDYVLFMGILGLQNTNARTDSVKMGLEEKGFVLNKQFEDTAEYDRAMAMSKMQQFIGTGKKFDVVIANNDEMALGAIEAMKGANITDIPVVGIDATANAIVAIESGEMACSIFQDAKGQGAGAFEFAYTYATGEKAEKYGWVPFKIVSKENVAEYK
ncbi:substrate-binding domain-containing protein [Anaeromicrobium sediminis]|uniref:Periplasmic binding protein domain-containing protein n=1 Tax=Anaeromicrobium sediminis TaxID=1478221 RepID=A0A267MB59_9FIRM|nr:substrate-binding domain-containing protein [Anaeromicrobium sediminis]PAB56642.1 hypothetical protein CCE28_20635 [Anaeromicrobium sediminis]